MTRIPGNTSALAEGPGPAFTVAHARYGLLPWQGQSSLVVVVRSRPASQGEPNRNAVFPS